MNEWKPFLGRITFFPLSGISSSSPSAPDLYRQIWGGEPDAFQKPPNPLLPGFAQGKRGGLIIHCTGHPARVDFNIRAAPSQVSQGTMDLIDHPIELRDELMRIIKLLDGSSVLENVSRVALILHFLNLKPSHADANKALTEVIPHRYGVTITDEEAFVFQINQPHMNREFQDIRMNFITKWSVEQFQTLTISIPIGGLPVQEGRIWASDQSNTVIAASVLFDNNNTPPTAARPLTVKEQSALLQEALDEGVRKQQEIGLNIGGF